MITISMSILVAACSGQGDGHAERGGSFSPVTLSNGAVVELHTPSGWSVTDYSGSGLIAETESNTIYAMIDPSRMDSEVLMNAGSDSDVYKQYEMQLQQGGMVNILFTPVSACAEVLAILGDSRGTPFDSDFLGEATLETVESAATEDQVEYNSQSVQGVVSLNDGMCAGANFVVFDSEPGRGADVVKQIATQSRVRQ